MTLPVPLQNRLNPEYKQVVWSGYVHALHPDQETLCEYKNMSQNHQTVTAQLLGLDGVSLPGLSPRIYSLTPNETIQLKAGAWAREVLGRGFQGQSVFIFETTDKEKPAPFAPAITNYWVSSDHCCMV